MCLRRLAQNRSSDGIPLLLLCPATTQLICANARAKGLIEVAARVLASFNLEIKTLSTSRCEGYFSSCLHVSGGSSHLSLGTAGTVHFGQASGVACRSQVPSRAQSHGTDALVCLSNNRHSSTPSALACVGFTGASVVNSPAGCPGKQIETQSEPRVTTSRSAGQE